MLWISLRRSSRRPALITLAAALVLVGPPFAAHASGAEAAPLPEMVVQDDAALLHRSPEAVGATLDRLVTLGVGRVRLTANWAVLTRDAEARAAPDAFDAADPAAYEQARWRGLDTAVRLARARGLRVLVDIGFWAPVWATTDATGPRARSNVDPVAYGRFALAVARRYDGSFAPPADSGPPPAPTADDNILAALFGPPDVVVDPPALTALPAIDEVALWNEPNHPALLLPQWRSAKSAPTSPDVYRRMVLSAYPKLKKLRPRLRVLVGNTSSTGGTPGTGVGPVPPLRFLRQLACVNVRLKPITTGMCKSFKALPGDGWAHHPYSSGQSPIRASVPSRPDDARLADLPRLSRLLDALAAQGRIAPAVRNIHLVEFGYETHDIGSRKGLSEGRQAHWLTWAEYRASRVPRVVALAQFLVGDQLPAATRVSDSTARPFGQFYTGLYDGEGHAKLAVRSFTTGLFAQRRTDGRVLLWVRLRGGSGRRTVAVQRRRLDGSWAALRTSAAPGRQRYSRFTAKARSATSRYARPVSADEAYRVVVTGGSAPVTGLETVTEPVRPG